MYTIVYIWYSLTTVLFIYTEFTLLGYKYIKVSYNNERSGILKIKLNLESVKLKNRKKRLVDGHFGGLVFWSFATWLFVAPPPPCWVFPTPVSGWTFAHLKQTVYFLMFMFLDFNVFLDLDIVFLRTLVDLGRTPLAGKLFTFLVSFYKHFYFRYKHTVCMFI